MRQVGVSQTAATDDPPPQQTPLNERGTVDERTPSTNATGQRTNRVKTAQPERPPRHADTRHTTPDDIHQNHQTNHNTGNQNEHHRQRHVKVNRHRNRKDNRHTPRNVRQQDRSSGHQHHGSRTSHPTRGANMKEAARAPDTTTPHIPSATPTTSQPHTTAPHTGRFFHARKR